MYELMCKIQANVDRTDTGFGGGGPRGSNGPFSGLL